MNTIKYTLTFSFCYTIYCAIIRKNNKMQKQYWCDYHKDSLTVKIFSHIRQDRRFSNKSLQTGSPVGG